MRIVLLGAPGSGKGTQAQRLQAKYGVPQVSSGDLLRDAVARGTQLGRKAKAVMDTGQLVSDDIVLGLIRARLSRPDAAHGFILDGFPRNIEQARALEQLLAQLGQPLEAVLLLDVRKELLVQRLAGRRICPQCGTVYNVHSLPAGTAACARDGAPLHQRPDDKEEVISRRLEVYQQQTQPLIEHYSRLGLLRAVAGEGTLEEVFERMEAAALAKPVPAGKLQVRALPRRAAKVKSGSRAGSRKAKSSAGQGRRKPARGKPRVAKKAAAKTGARRTANKAARRGAQNAKRRAAQPKRRPAAKRARRTSQPRSRR